MSRDDALVDRLVELWEVSVRATHDFLSEEDIRGIRTYVPDALRSIADLRIVRDAEGVPVAFMGCDGRRLEMLFVDPACRGAGVGTALVREAFIQRCDRRSWSTSRTPRRAGSTNTWGSPCAAAASATNRAVTFRYCI